MSHNDRVRKKQTAGAGKPGCPQGNGADLSDGFKRVANGPMGHMDVELGSPRVHVEEDPFFRARMPRTTHWSVAWSDLMMTMFILFLVMYVYKDANRVFLSSEGLGGQYGSVVSSRAPMGSGGGVIGDELAARRNSLSKIYDLSRQTIQQEELGSLAAVDLVSDETVRIILTADLLFEPGRAEIKAESRNALRKIAALLRRLPYVINVVGHTDNSPIHTERFPSNWELSVGRASAVARFLIAQTGLPSERFFVSGHSSNQPLQPNDTPEHRAANRRVEIILTREVPAAS